MAKVVIFGASSATAGEVAALYAARGDELHLVARSREKLSALAAKLEASSPNLSVQQTVADFDRLDENAELVSRVLAARGGADVVLIAHGLLGDQLESERDFA